MVGYLQHVDRRAAGADGADRGLVGPVEVASKQKAPASRVEEDDDAVIIRLAGEVHRADDLGLQFAEGEDGPRPHVLQLRADLR